MNDLAALDELEIDSNTSLAEFRAQVREWIGDNAPPGLARLTDWSRLLRGGGEWWSYPAEMATDLYRTWERRLTKERLVCGHWPARYGGRDLTIEQCRVLDEECLRANVPRVFREQGEAWVGPSIMAHGTEEQKDYFLPKIVDGSHRYAQGFSEPNHGSDLASLETRGVVDGDEIVITGQKVWTTGADSVNQIFVLCRTDPDPARRHRGLSYVIVDIPSNAGRLTFRPIKTLTGEHEFCESFFDEVRAPLDHVIGGINNGWRVAMTTLENERVGRAASARNAAFAKDLADLTTLARARGKTGDPHVRQRMTELYATLRVLEQWCAPGRARVHQSIEKLVASEWEQHLGELALEVLDETAAIRPDGSVDSAGSADSSESADYPLNRWQRGYLRSLSATIASGSSEIQRNVIAERLLQLPREARPA